MDEQLKRYVENHLRENRGVQEIITALRKEMEESDRDQYLFCPVITYPKTEFMLNRREERSFDWTVILFVCKQNPDGIYIIFTNEFGGIFSHLNSLVGRRETLFIGTHPDNAEYRNPLEMEEVKYHQLDWETGEISHSVFLS